jgi:hypothetical protein
MSIPKGRGPRALTEVLGELFTVRGYGRFWARQELERAWDTAVGEPLCRQTHLGEVRRGVLNVTVSHPALLEELASFRKPSLLAALRAVESGTTIQDIRFRVGVVEAVSLGASPSSLAREASRPPEPARSRSGRPRGARPGTRPGKRGGPTQP